MGFGKYLYSDLASTGTLHALSPESLEKASYKYTLWNMFRESRLNV